MTSAANKVRRSVMPQQGLAEGWTLSREFGETGAERMRDAAASGEAISQSDFLDIPP
tara:strand:- start:2295 stop:2465 length:171 start_codon:yes stop_codon:yes gene_type:complete